MFLQGPLPGPPMQCQCFKSQALNSELTCEDTFPPGEGAGFQSSPYPEEALGQSAPATHQTRQSALAARAPHSEGSPGQRCCREQENKAPTVSKGWGLAERPLTPGFSLGAEAGNSTLPVCSTLTGKHLPCRAPVRPLCSQRQAFVIL